MRRRDAVKLILAAGATGCARAASKHPAMTDHEHFVPVVTALGAAIDDPTALPGFPITGFTYGSATQRSLQLG